MILNLCKKQYLIYLNLGLACAKLNACDFPGSSVELVNQGL